MSSAIFVKPFMIDSPPQGVFLTVIKPADMHRGLPRIACHALNLFPFTSSHHNIR